MATFRRLVPETFTSRLGPSDRALLLTAKPFDNNFFFAVREGAGFISFYEWGRLTNLPVENGLAYFIATLALDSITPELNHDGMTGCISDFLWQKTDIDIVMRSAYLCKECRTVLDKRTGEHTSRVISEIETLLDSLSQASRAGKNIVEYVLKSHRHDSFDCFISYNSADRKEVRGLVSEIKNMSLTPWFDEEQLRPGLSWQEELERQIALLSSAVVCVGSSGIGPWQSMEMRGFLAEMVDRRCSVIPVILPTATAIPELPIFMRSVTYVDMRTKKRSALSLLEWGITGIHPGR